MENVETFKAAGMGKLSGRFLKDGVEILSKAISETCNLSNSHGIFPNTCKVAKLKSTLRKAKKVEPSNYRPISFLTLI